MKRTLCLFLALILAVGICFSAPVTITASAAEAVSGTCGARTNTGGKSSVTWAYDSATTTLTISGTGAMADFTSTTMPWYSYRGKIAIIVINKGVTSIGDSAFSGCSRLTSVTIPESVTEIGANAFSSCTKLVEVSFPSYITIDGITNNIDKNRSVFSGCTSLESVTFAKGISAIAQEFFYNCSSLKSITGLESVQSIRDQAFYGCESLESVTFGSSLRTTGRNIFYGCTSLKSINVSDNSRFSSVDGVLFNGAKTKLVAYPVGKEDESYTIPVGVLTIGDNAFATSTNLVEVIIPDSVTTIGQYAFDDCTALKSLRIPDSVTEIDFGAFDGCTALTTLTIPDSVTTIGKAIFYKCTHLESVTLPKGMETIGYNFFYECKSLKTVTMPDNVASIERSAFYACESLEQITIPDGVGTIADNAFEACIKLADITIPDSVTYIGIEAFYHCKALETITILGSATGIGGNAFSGISATATVNVPCSWDENPKYEAFRDGALNIAPHSNYANGRCGVCLKICSPHKTTGESNICTICGAAGGNCGVSTNDGGESSVTWTYDTNAKTLIISGSGDMADYSEGTEPWSEYKTEITNIVISEGITKIDELLFGASYSSLVSINVDADNTEYSSEKGVLFNFDKTKLIRYPSGDAMESYIIPSSVTEIGTAAFNGCISLTTITIPESIVTIEESAFSSGTTVIVPCGWDENNSSFTFDDDIKVKIAPHKFENSVCINCDYECTEHDYVGGNGKCKYCSFPCTHGTTGDRANCSVCGCVKAGDFTLSFTNGGNDRCEYDDQTGVLTVKNGAEVTISNTNPDAPTTNTIFVAYGASANITLAGVNINVSETPDACAFKIRDDSTGNVTITLADGTTNILISGENCAGLQKNCSGDTTIGKLTIQGEQYGTGCLTAQGGNSGAGIGGGNSEESSEITISGGTVTATGGGMYGAGIGGGYSGEGSEITITGGTVTAIGGMYGAGIGGGYDKSGSEITISGGTVTAQGGFSGAGIGGGDYGEGSEITISGGSVKAVAGSGANNIGGGRDKESIIPTDGSGNNVYLMIIENENVAPIKINNEAITPIKHGTENRVYVYLKADDYTVKVGNNELDYRFFEAINRIIVKNNYDLDFTISGGKVDEDYVGYEDTLYILKDTPLTIANKRDFTTTNDKIVVAKDVSANITLAGVNIDVSATTDACAFKIEDNSAGNVTITLADGTENCFKSSESCAGLQKNGIGDTIGKLTIQGEQYGTGCLTAQGGDRAAGIGGGYSGASSKITISGGTVTAEGGSFGAGIGGGFNGAGSEITISGGTVTAQGGGRGAGIGGGDISSGSEIEISGGTITATGGTYGAGIGGGDCGDGSEITISGGTITAKGGSSGAGIGGGDIASGSEINISGGTITATGGTDGAGIGGGDNASGSEINISGGTITAQGGSSGAGIGGGLKGTGSKITISAGTITAQGGRYGAGIGGGDYGAGSKITISGGSVKAVAGTSANKFGGGKDKESVIPTDGSGNNVYLFELAVDGTSEVAINSNTNYPKKHFTEDKLYIYLPANTAQSPNVVEVGEMTTKYTYDTTGLKWLTVVDVLSDDIVFTYDGEEHNIPESSYYTISGDNQKNAGTYTVKVVLNDKENTVWSDNTTDDKYCSFTIKKAQPTVTAPEAKTLTYTGSAEALVTEGTVVGGTLQYSLNGTTYSTEIPSGTYAGEYTVWYKVIGDGNHNNTDPICITVNIAKVTPVITGVAGTAITYGNTLNASTLSGSAHYSNTDNTVVEGSFSWKDTNVKPTVSDSNNTSYTVVFTPTDTTNYNTAEATITLIVNKAENAPYIPGDTISVPYSSKTVSAVTLPTDWVWQDADKNITLEVEKTTNATAIYTGADKGNYENESVTVAITRSKCEHSETELRNAKAATCTEGGYTGDTYCLICNITTVMGNEIKAKGHTEVIVTGKAPTHTETGLTDGKVCSVCDTIIEAQQVIPCLIPGEIKAEEAESNSFSATVVDINSIVTKLQLTEEEKALIEQGADMKI
ncbi:MAG: leucine-rich repeat protein, partial [Clostridia bacterium]|nr:leucine-rich repeat protein [Clostridia bacterium]